MCIVLKNSCDSYKILMKHLLQIILMEIMQEEREALAQFCRLESHVNEESERAGAGRNGNYGPS